MTAKEASAACLTVLNSPFVQHHLASIRDKTTPSPAFRQALTAIANVLLLEASRYLPTETKTVETPLATTQAQVFDTNTPLLLIPILRAGLAFADPALNLFPWASVYHLGLYRDEATLKPVEYYNKLPDRFKTHVPQVLLLDPMLATGGSALACIDLLVERGLPPERLVFVCLIASPEGVRAVHENYPTVTIITAALDERLNEVGYIVPGLGDAGDRTFGT